MKTLLEKDGSPGAVGIWNGFSAGRTTVFTYSLICSKDVEDYMIIDIPVDGDSTD